MRYFSERGKSRHGRNYTPCSKPCDSDGWRITCNNINVYVNCIYVVTIVVWLVKTWPHPYPHHFHPKERLAFLPKQNHIPTRLDDVTTHKHNLNNTNLALVSWTSFGTQFMLTHFRCVHIKQYTEGMQPTATVCTCAVFFDPRDTKINHCTPLVTTFCPFYAHTDWKLQNLLYLTLFHDIFHVYWNRLAWDQLTHHQTEMWSVAANLRSGNLTAIIP